MAYTQDDTIHSGDNYTVTINCQDRDGGSVAVDGGSATYQVAASPYASAPLVTLTSGAGYVSLSGTVATLTIPGTATVNLDGEYFHELQVVDASSNTHTAMVGRLTIKKDLI